MKEFKEFLYNVVLRHLINELYNLGNKYLDSKTQAFDEVVEDIRDYELTGGEDQIFPDEYAFDIHGYADQRKDGYRMSCTAQATVECGNLQRKVKADKTRKSGFKLWDLMIEAKLGDVKRGAYLINAIKQAKKEYKIDGYYRVRTINAMKSAIYNYSNLLATGSSKIDWKLLRQTNGIVSIASSGYGHAFYIRGWNNTGWICVNSYGDKHELREFIIPFSLTFDVLFNSTYALVVNPEWEKLSKEELFSNYKLRRNGKL